MTKTLDTQKLSKLTKQRSALLKQIEDSKQKIQTYEAKISQALGKLALAHNLDKLDQKTLITEFKNIAKEHNLA